MKSDFHFHFYSRIFISLLIFAFGFFLLQQSVSTTAQVSPADNVELTGWAWSKDAGWISLSCNNDFDGDGVLENTCATNDYGLKVVNKDDIPYIQGCAWAGTPLVGESVCSNTGVTCTSSVDCPVTIPPATCGLAPAGWLCFSDQVFADISAPDGIPIRQTDWQEQEPSLCVVATGHCNYDVNAICSTYGQCPVVGSWCVQPLYRGVCATTSQADEDRLNALIGTYDPTATDPPTGFEYCYVSSQCAVGENCYYPQVAGRGQCAINNSGIISYNGDFCTYDMNCSSGYYCEFNPVTDFVASPQAECTLGACPSGYQCDVGEITDFPAYPNALDYSLLGDKASWLKVAGSGGAEGNDLVGFPIQTKLVHDVYPDNTGYDPDDPDLASHFINNQSDSNPINGCFNCYEEKTLKCAPSYTVGCTTEGVGDAACQGVCNASTELCSNNNTKTCVINGDCQEQCVVRDIKKKCANCLEYFYYKDEEVLRCDNVYQFICTEVTTENSPECGVNIGGACMSYSANKRCGGNNYFYCNENDDCKIREACITLSSTEKRCANSYESICSTSADCPILKDYGDCITKTPGDLEKVLAGYNCQGETITDSYGTRVGSCTIQNMGNSCVLNAYNQNINSCGSCEAVFKTTGVMLDNKHNSLITTDTCNASGHCAQTPTLSCAVDKDCNEKANLCGWAQNPAFGWINFSPRITTSTKPYFSVEQGNIYSKSRIVTLYHPPFGKFNASYLIESGGSITNFVSDATTKEKFQGELADRPLINFLSLTNLSAKYTNALGKLDYKGLITVAKNVGVVDYNKYGGVIEEEVINPGVYADNAIFDEPFNNKVFHITGVPANFGYGVEFGNGTDLVVECGNASTPSGAGIIVVEGNMKIKNNITYDSSCNINNLKQIPSLVWIVKGDVSVDTNVTEIAGTFIVLGNGLACPNSGCGQFKSTTASTPRSSDPAVEVFGNVLAKKFVLDRVSVNVYGDPAEQFTNDGRLQSNPPLGLTDMSKVIPRFSSY